MARFYLRKMGHKVERLPRLRSPRAARFALDQRGWRNCADMLDAQAGLTRLPAPAFMLPGDLAYCSSACGLGSILICAAPNKLLGWLAQAPEIEVWDVGFDDVEACWRV